MAHAAVTPVQQRQDLPVALVEVAMDQRVSKAASRHLIEPTGESAHKTRERDPILGGDFVPHPGFFIFR